MLESKLKNYSPSGSDINHQTGKPRVKLPPNDVCLLYGPYFGRNFKAENERAQAFIDSTVTEYHLNTEQERAFRIIANHASGFQEEQLRMYLGGMGGTGKSQVIKAIIHFFGLRNEAHRFAVVAPTGTAAALLNGFTYHYLLAIQSRNEEDNDEGFRNLATAVATASSRLEGVEYIFLDEVSMLGCHELHNISSRLAHVANIHDQPFGGMNMIFAGDFAQLPPTGGKQLYSRAVSKVQWPEDSPHDQENTMGMSLWHQITTVVMLVQNMRQRTASTEDNYLRQALVNMRYASCTAQDVAFLRTRVASPLPGRPKLNEKRFRNVSVITAWNAQKDCINDIGCVRFAADSGQTLTNFYSIDTLSSGPDKLSKKKRGRKAVKMTKATQGMSKSLQETLWRCPPSCSPQHIPAKLSLCLGMPVMIRNNDATELCITKGQEAIVAG